MYLPVENIFYEPEYPRGGNYGKNLVGQWVFGVCTIEWDIFSWYFIKYNNCYVWSTQ